MTKQEFAYRAEVAPRYDAYFNWRVKVYREDGSFVEEGLTQTKWGAKSKAKQLAYLDAEKRIGKRKGFTMNFTVKVKS